MKGNIKFFEIKKTIDGTVNCFKMMLYSMKRQNETTLEENKEDEANSSSNHIKDVSKEINNLFKSVLKTNKKSNTENNNIVIIKYLFQKIIGEINENRKFMSSFKNVFQIQNLKFTNIIFKLFELDTDNFQEIIQKEIKSNRS